MSEPAVATDGPIPDGPSVVPVQGVRSAVGWPIRYVRWAVVTDAVGALAAGLFAFGARFDDTRHLPGRYLALSLALPVVWVVAVALAGGYDVRFIGVGADEFRKVANAAIAVTAAVTFTAYATKTELSRGYVVVALVAMTMFGLAGRYTMRKHLHSLRQSGSCMRNVVVVGHASVVADMAALLHRDRYHGLRVVAACVADAAPPRDIEGVPVVAGLSDIGSAVRRFGADTVAVLACPEMSGIRLRELAWDLEKTGTELCVAPALLDVAGPRTTIRPVAGLPLLHLDHPEFTGTRQVVKELFDRTAAVVALAITLPVFGLVCALIAARDGRPVLFRQTRIGRDGQTFRLYKFRTMVRDAEQVVVELARLNESDGLLFKMRNDPRVTATGGWLRRWSLDELPQLLNVLRGEMSLVGPRPALPQEAMRYEPYVQRRLAVKPGITGLWQVSGRSDLSWEESVRLDIRYVENWSFMLDVQILWKTLSAVIRGSGAY
jgi:exopolysaccharide biosynthesis polyprenyl glycosylphosphotransferase